MNTFCNIYFAGWLSSRIWYQVKIKKKKGQILEKTQKYEILNKGKNVKISLENMKVWTRNVYMLDARCGWLANSAFLCLICQSFAIFHRHSGLKDKKNEFCKWKENFVWWKINIVKEQKFIFFMKTPTNGGFDKRAQFFRFFPYISSSSQSK